MRRPAAAAMLLFTLAACGSPAAADRPSGAAAFDEALRHERTVRTGADITLPFDRYLLAPDQQRDVDRAVQVLAGRCMRGFGFAWQTLVPEAANRSSRADRYGLINAGAAAARGYHPAPEPPAQKSAATDAVVGGVYFGTGRTSHNGRPVPAGGCLGQARDQLAAGGTPALQPLEIQRLQNQLYGRAEDDTRVRAAMTRWRACMTAAGYDYPDIWAANNDPRWTAPKPAPGEIATAGADVACKLRAGLPSVWLTVETAYQAATIAERPADFQAIRRQTDHQLSRARAVLSQAGVDTPAK